MTFKSLLSAGIFALIFGTFSSQLFAQSDYSLTVEEHAVDIIPGETTYRLYVNLANPDDFLSSVFGNDVDPLTLETENGFYNDSFGAAVASGINPAFLAFFPSIGGDSWITIGIESQNVGDEVAISTVEDSEQPFVPAFNAGSAIDGQNFELNTSTGGAWFVLNGTPNGLPDAEGRVLIMQLTTSGGLSGVLPVQVFENGEGTNDLRFTFNFDGVGTFGGAVTNEGGCTDATACNYDAAATEDDGSCTYADTGYDCDGNCLADGDDDGVCDEFEVGGCTDASACNYDAAATDDDASCTYADAGYDCDGNCLNDTDGDGICDEFEEGGCTDASACNYDATASDDDGSCTYADTGYDCDGNCLTDTDGDGVCDEFEETGCTDSGACNYDSSATDDDGSCTYEGCEEAYTLTVEEHAVDIVPGLTTYRLYVNLVNPDDFVSSVFGNEEDPLSLETETGFYNDGFGAAVASGINPAFLTFFPTIAADSWITIGIESQNEGDEVAISTVEDPLQPFVAAFASPSEIDGQNIVLNTTTGGAWFVLNGTPNGLPDADGRVLIMQLSTSGGLSGVLPVQIFENGEGTNDLRFTFIFDGVGTFGGAVTSEGGCTDASACNFDAAATEDDGSCTYADAGYDCDGNCLADADDDGVCDEFEVGGCTDTTACNYDATATDEDGSCTFAETGYDCDGNCLADADGDGVCDEFEDGGCTDATACNYDPAASDDDGSCTYADAGYDCDGNCLADGDEDGVCDEFEVAGCTDSEACNYDSTATDDDGTCTYEGCEPAYTLTIEEHATDIVPGETTYRFYVNLVNPDDFVSSVFGNDVDPLSIQTEAGFYNDPFGASVASSINPAFFPAFPTIEADSWITIGIESQNEGDEVPISTVEDPAQPFVAAFASGSAIDGQDINVDTSTGGAWYILNGTPNGLPDADGRVLIMQLTTSAGFSGILPVQIFEFGNGANDIRFTFEFNGVGTYDPALENNDGCMDPTACNYDATAEEDDGSCSYAETGYDCDGNCLNDADEDGVCDEFEVAGCTDSNACNYDMNATDDNGSCTYAETGYDCDGECLNDADDDGVCDEFEVAGCSDDDACNYDIDATDDDGSCTYAETGYDCDGNCLNDADEDGICDEFETGGCTDDTACNYDNDATDDDGSCIYAETGYDCDGNCLNDADGDGVCDEFEIDGCTDATACNFDSLATEDDGSCEYPDTYYDCDGNCLNDVDGDGICDEFETEGCTDSEACNYIPTATEDDGSCTYPEAGYDCDGNCLNDEDGDGICDEFEVAGCTDTNACNYDEAATDDDGSCEFPETFYDCDGNCINDADGNGICDELEVGGCTDVEACNYDPSATFDDGSCAELDDCGVCGGSGVSGCGIAEACNYDPAVTCSNAAECEFDSCAGCLDETACNYDPEATVAGVCDFPEVFWEDCDGNCLEGYDEDGNGICDPEDVPGCTNPDAVNYNPNATVDNGTCIIIIVGCGNITACNYDPSVTVNAPGLCDFPDTIYEDCDGNCYNDEDGDGVCDEMEIEGCTTPGPGYNPFATEDDGSCPVGGCIIPSPVFACNYDPDADYLIFSMCVNPPCGNMSETPIPGSLIVPGCMDVWACNYDPAATEDDGSCEYLSCSGCNDPSACNFDPDAIYNDGSCEYLSCAVTGCTNDNACNYDPEANYDDGSCDFESCYGCTNPDADNYDPTATVDDGTCEILGCTLAIACNYDPAATSYDGSCDFTSCEGCMNETACNYDPEATIAGTCDFTSCQGCTDPEADNYDSEATQDDGSCAYIGCTVASACNYNPEANVADNTMCTYPEAGYDCDGTCLNDSDGDGVCDEFEVAGCQDEMACNYNAAATDDDAASCEYAEEYYDCDGICLNDMDADGVCDELEIAGCTDAEACNYDEAATDDNGSCEYAEEFYNCEGNCLNDSDGDGICDELEIPGCTDPEAENYNPDATDDDGSCYFCDIVVTTDETTGATDGGNDGSIDVTVSGGTEPYTLEWTGPDGFTSNDEDLTELFAGDYTLSVTDANGCTSSIDVTVDAIVGLIELNALSFTVYPNPAQDMIWIEANGWRGPATFDVYDMAGRLALSIGINVEGATAVNVNGLAPGRYEGVLLHNGKRGVVDILIR